MIVRSIYYYVYSHQMASLIDAYPLTTTLRPTKRVRCMYPAETLKSKAVTVKLRQGKSRRKTKLLSVKEKVEGKIKETFTLPEKNEVC